MSSLWHFRSFTTGLGLMAMLAVRAWGAAVSDEQAARAALAWLERGYAPGMAAESRAVAAVTPLVDVGSGAELRVVTLAGGGFIVTSADDRVTPVLAFAESGTGIEPDEHNPFWQLLSGDIAFREAVAGVARRQTDAKRSVKALKAAETSVQQARARWAELLDHAGGKKAADTPRAAGATSSLSSVRVAPLVKSRWNQGGNIFNYYTPNGYPCGCVMTAFAQVMRYWRAPSGTVKAQSNMCRVDGVSKTYTMKGGTYDWNNMPLVPGANISTTQRKAIGKLTYDLGVAVGVSWGSKDSSASVSMGRRALLDTFGYANAVDCAYGDWNLAAFQQDLCPNLDAGCPVVLSVKRSGGGHAVVADGYGFSQSDFYVHINFGWGGSQDGWYCPPDLATTTYQYSSIARMIGNIFPNKTGLLLSGRVCDEKGRSLTGVKVKCKIGTNAAVTATSGQNGIFSLYGAAGAYTVEASSGGSSDFRYGKLQGSLGNSASGNSWSKDLVLKPLQFPTAPTGVSATDGRSVKYVRVTWNSVKDAESFLLYRHTANDPEAATLLAKGLVKRTYDDKTAVPGKRYYYWVKAVNVRGKSPFSKANSGFVLTLAHALDATSLAFSTTPEAPWGAQIATSHDGSDAAQSAHVGNGQTTWLQTTVSGAGTISFFWKVSGATNAATLAFQIDGKAKRKITGETAWAKVALVVPDEGQHTLSWTYGKEGSVAAGADCGWVDQVVWTPGLSRKVTFQPNGGSCTTKQKQVTAGEQVGTLPVPTWKNHVFLGWYTGKSSGTKIAQTLKIVEDRTVYAHWKEGNRVTFDAVGGTATPASRIVKYDAAVGKLPQATRTNYVLVGWYTAKSGGSKIAATTRIKAPRTFYAHWTLAPRTVKWNANGGTCNTAQTIVKHGKEVGTLPKASRKNCVLLGWYTAKTGGTKITKTTKITKNRTFYARWTTATKTVTWNANGGSCASKSKVVKHGAAVGTLPKPTRTDYTFLGWYTAKSGGTKIATTTKITKNQTFYAQWRPNEPVAEVTLGGNALPTSWLQEYGLLGTARTTAEVSARWQEQAANGRSLMDCYIAGLSPLDETAQFLVDLEMTNGTVKVTYDPDRGAERSYTVEGKVDLTDEQWVSPTNATHRFFRVRVALPQ